MGEKDFEEPGLTTTEALNRLQNDIDQVLNQFKLSQRARKSKSWIRDALHHCSQHTTINWISALSILLAAISLVVAYKVNRNNTELLYQAAFILLLLTLCLFIELLDNKLRHNEILRRVKAVLAKIRDETSKISWASDNYPHLLAPFSPCITLQWTYRDNKLVNLPWALLVKDDVILIRPGQISPGYCESLDKNAEYPLLHAKEVYGPTLQNANEFFSTPKSRKPLDNKKYRLLETPYLNNLRIALEQALDRPVTVQNQQRHFIMIKIIERLLLPVILVIIFIVSCVKYVYLEVFIGTGTWLDLFVLTPVVTILPLLPLLFPVCWNCLNYLGMARFKTIFDATSHLQHTQTLFEDQDSNQVDNPKLKHHCQEVWNNFVNILKGNESIMVRSANILHVLGSLTALCCVDKKGILSWPNPTAEKVFFLHNTDSLSQASSLANLGELSTDADSLRGNTTDSLQNTDAYLTTVPEVLDLTHNQNDPFKLHFDDTDWHKHLNSLKPLGLAILLNTCNMDTQENYTKFCSHITCEAMYNENLVPVTNRRCLCELAKEIGFVDQAQKIFTLEQQLSSFRHLQNEMARRDNKYARSLHLSTKLKFPFPHMFAVVVKELSSGSMQLLSQGTADIILDSCIEYWDGHDLCPLSHSDRKKIQDFYQRCSLTAYCTAFAYRPLHKSVNDKLSQLYLELPNDSRHLYLNHRSPTPVHCDCRTVLEPRIKTPLGQFYSTDSLLYNDSPCSDVSDIDSCFEMQCNQVFIGMVTMQYQAQLDMVHLIEQLERACIRFVHFSKENELRSRVFSEKMGLESGWNCHISLLSERSRRESGPSECWANNGTARVSSPADLPHHSPTCAARPIFDTDRLHNRGLSNVFFDKHPTFWYWLACYDFRFSNKLRVSKRVRLLILRFVYLLFKNHKKEVDSCWQQGPCWLLGYYFLHDIKYLALAENLKLPPFFALHWLNKEVKLQSTIINTIGLHFCNGKRVSTLDSSKALSYSAPSAINLEHSVVKFDTEHEPLARHPYEQNQDTENHAASQDSVHFHGVDINSTHEWQSLSCLTDSTEQSAPINFDMSNRAKLPRGIDKIRPHIENIDNVPLLVSLFTDCTASSTKEMVRIMQDYGEVICVIGSSANYETVGIFMQADASIAIEPLYPQVCQKSETYRPVQNSISPIELSRALNSVPCSLSLRREDPLSIFFLIVEARHYMSLMWNAVQFWLCSCITISVMQLAAAVLMLPALLTTGQVLWICCIIIPILSISLMGTSADPEIMKKPQGKKQIGLNSEVFIFVLWCYGAKFLPMVLIVILLFGGTLASYCTDICQEQNCTCTLFYMPAQRPNSTVISDWTNQSSSVPSAQHFCVLLILLHLITISVSFVHREHSVWHKSPHGNFLWLGSIIFLLIMQMIFTLLSVNQTAREYDNNLGFQIANFVVIFAFLSPLLTFAINELVKREEIKANLRYQRRARLDFGTKLGMNSPF